MRSRVVAQPAPVFKASTASRPTRRTAAPAPSSFRSARTGPLPPASTFAEILDCTRADRTHLLSNAAAMPVQSSPATTRFRHTLWNRSVAAITPTGPPRSPETKARTSIVLSRSRLLASSPDPPKEKTKPSDAAKAQTGVSLLRAQAAAVKGKLEAFSVEKLWRSEYHTSTDSRFAEIKKLFDEHARLQKELNDILDEWYLFEHESTKTLIEKLNRVWNQLAQMYWDLRRASEAEAKYETKSSQTEGILWAQIAAFNVDLQNADKPGKELSAGDFQALRSRLDQLSAAVDKLRADETAARKQYTGSADLVSHGP